MTAALATPRVYGLGLLGCLLAGLPVGLDVELVGRLTGTELVFLLMLPVAWPLHKVPPLTWPVHTLVGLALVWLTVQYVSDMVNDSALDDTLRGAARAGITAVLIVGFFTLIADRVRNLHALFIAIAAGIAFGSYVNPSIFVEGDPWKFGYGGAVTMLVMGVTSLLWALRRRISSLVLCLAISALNLWLGYRSMAGIAFMTGLLLMLSALIGAQGRRFATLRLSALVLAVYAGGTGVIELYADAARSGLLGVEAQEKFLGQVVAERGVLLSGRSEWPVALEAVQEKPLLGHGSWAVNERYFTKYWEMSGLSADQMPFDEVDLIPTHSHLMGAWVEGGILAALFWLYVITLLARAVAATVNNRALSDPMILFTLMNLAWSVLFSPYGLTNRVLSCFAIVVAATVLRLDAATTTTGAADR